MIHDVDMPDMFDDQVEYWEDRAEYLAMDTRGGDAPAAPTDPFDVLTPCRWCHAPIEWSVTAEVWFHTGLFSLRSCLGDDLGHHAEPEPF